MDGLDGASRKGRVRGQDDLIRGKLLLLLDNYAVCVLDGTLRIVSDALLYCN